MQPADCEKREAVRPLGTLVCVPPVVMEVSCRPDEVCGGTLSVTITAVAFLVVLYFFRVVVAAGGRSRDGARRLLPDGVAALVRVYNRSAHAGEGRRDRSVTHGLAGFHGVRCVRACVYADEDRNRGREQGGQSRTE